MAKAIDKLKGPKADIHTKGFHTKGGNSARQTKEWAPLVISPRVQEAMMAIKEVLKDGEEHSIKDIKAAIKGLGSRERYIYDALKAMPEVDKHNHGRGGSFYRFKSPEKLAEEKKAIHPAVARDTQIAREKDDKRSPKHSALRDRVEEVLPGYDPVVSIAEIANDASVPIAIRLECHRDVARYTTPQVKATEITSEDQPIALNFKWEA